MAIEHVEVTKSSWYLIADSIIGRAPQNSAEITLRNTFLTKMLSSNGMSLKSTVVMGQVLHYNTAHVPTYPSTPTPPPPTPTVRVPKGVPFAASSPFNQQTPTNVTWIDHPILRQFEDNGQTVTRHWFGGVGQLHICHGQPTDPLWTITMPDFGSTHPTFNRYWKAATWQMRLPAAGPTVGGNEDAIIALVDESNGNYAEIGNRSAYTINTTNRTIIGVPGAWWARGNVDTGTGVGGYLADGGNSAGIRAANFSWMAGAITGYDVDQVMTGKRDDFGHALAVMLSYGTLSNYLVVPPATAPDNGGHDGPIAMGARIGIPRNVARPARIQATDKLGVAYFNTLQRYGAFVGDFAGPPWPIFQVDAESVTGATINPMWVWWGEPNVPTDSQGIATAGPQCTQLLRVVA